MRRTWSVAVARDDRRDADWQHIGKVVQSWAGEATVTPVGQVMWLADTGSAEVADALAGAVAALGLQPLRSSRTVYEDEDYAAADLVGVTGVDLSLDPPFVRNRAAAFRAAPPCPRCGHHDQFDVTPVRPPRIDEAMLDEPAPNPAARAAGLGGGRSPGRRPAAVHAAGQRAARPRYPGHVLEEIVNADGARSTRMAWLRASVAVLVPCPRHTRVVGAPFCPVCGAAHGGIDGYLWLPRSAAGPAEIVSRHPHRAAMLHLSPRAYAAIDGACGVRRGDPVMVCEDKRRSDHCRGLVMVVNRVGPATTRPAASRSASRGPQ